MSNEHNNREDRLDREPTPAQEMNVESSSATTTTLAEPFTEFGKSLETQLLRLEACYVLAGTPPRRLTGLSGRGRNLR